MRRVLITLVAVSVLGVGAAFAQSSMAASYNTTQWAGVALGYPFSVYYGVNNAIGNNIDVRGRLTYGFWNIGVGADILYDAMTLQDTPLTIYVGGGPNFNYGFYGVGIGIGLSAVGGVEYRFSDQLGAFAELGAGYTFYLQTPAISYFGLGFGPRGALGVNYHF